MERLLLSIPEAARTLGIGRSKLYEIIAAGGLETVSIGRRRLVRADSIKTLASQGAPCRAA